MKTTRITDQITYVEPDSMGNFGSCAGIIINADQKIFIDINMGRATSVELIQKEQPDLAFITHYHLDHSIWVRQVQDFSSAKVFISQKEKKYLTSLDFVLKETAAPYGLENEWKNFIVNRLGFNVLDHFLCFDKTTRIKEIVKDIHFDMVLLNTPGHSPGHTSFYFPDQKILLSGDMGLDRFGPWYGWNDCSIKNLVDSLLRLKSLDIRLILTSHGGIIGKDIDQAFDQSLNHIKQREKKIIDKLGAGQSPETIINKGLLYKNKDKQPYPLGSFLNMWDTAMFNHHESLLKEGGLIKFFPELYS